MLRCFFLLCFSAPFLGWAGDWPSGPVVTAGTNVPHHFFSPYQNKPVSWVLTGKVINEDSQPMPGVTVAYDRTGKTLATDVKGEFIVEIMNEQDSIRLTFVGYQAKTFLVGNARSITLKMDPDT